MARPVGVARVVEVLLATSASDVNVTDCTPGRRATSSSSLANSAVRARPL